MSEAGLKSVGTSIRFKSDMAVISLPGLMSTPRASVAQSVCWRSGISAGDAYGGSRRNGENFAAANLIREVVGNLFDEIPVGVFVVARHVPGRALFDRDAPHEAAKEPVV